MKTGVGMRRVFAVMWDGMRPWAWMFWVLTVLQITSAVLFTQIPVQIKKIFDLLSTGDPANKDALIGVVVVVFMLQLGRLITNRIAVQLVDTLESRTMPRLMQQSFNYILGHSSHFFENMFAGALVQRIRRLSNAYRTMMDSWIYDFLPIFVQIVMSIAVLSWFEPIFALCVGVWVFVYMTLNYMIMRWKLTLDIPRSRADSEVTAVLADAFTNISSIVSFATASHESAYFQRVSNAFGAILIKSWNVSTIMFGLSALSAALVEFAVFYIGVGMWAQGELTIGTFVLVQLYIISLAMNLWGFGELIRKVFEAYAESLEVVEILDTPHGVSDVPGAAPIAVTDGVVEFRDVSFAYNETRTVMDGVSVAIPGGQKVAIIGPSGAGKSTFVRLLLRTYDATGGQVLIDGQNIARVTQESLRRAIAFVPQDPSLFHRSLRENIRYGRLEATDAEVEEAAKRAHCHEFIVSLPQGYDTLVGERGVKLSGGERQRVAIARAMLKNAPILVLDEATSSLDSESEVLIQKALDELIQEKIVIVIAHRLSTIRKMDRILVFDGGRIAEDGTHDALLGNPGSLYKRLWDLQAGGFLKDQSS